MKVSLRGSRGLVHFTSAPSAGPVATPTHLLEVSWSRALVVSPEPPMASCGGMGHRVAGPDKSQGAASTAVNFKESCYLVRQSLNFLVHSANDTD